MPGSLDNNMFSRLLCVLSAAEDRRRKAGLPPLRQEERVFETRLIVRAGRPRFEAQMEGLTNDAERGPKDTA